MDLVAAKLISLVDLTSLNESDTSFTIDQLCQKAQVFSTSVAAVCVYPRFVQQARRALGEEVAVATVVNFPSGEGQLADIVEVVRKSIQSGASEIDAVLPYRALLQGRVAEALAFVKVMRSTCGDLVLKIIIESGVLLEEHFIRKASEICIEGGADFIKTSTGKVAQGASIDAVRVILQAIQHHPESAVGIKISGGVQSLQGALEYVELVENWMGKDWITPDRLRIGASRLLDELLFQGGAES